MDYSLLLLLLLPSSNTAHHGTATQEIRVAGKGRRAGQEQKKTLPRSHRNCYLVIPTDVDVQIQGVVLMQSGKKAPNAFGEQSRGGARHVKLRTNACDLPPFPLGSRPLLKTRVPPAGAM